MANTLQPRRSMAPFFTIWTGELISLIGSQLAQFAIVWWLTKTTGSATVLATATLFAMLPGVLLGPFAGAVVDRWDRRWIMIIADGVSALAAAALAVLFWTGAIQIWHVYLIMLVRSIGGTFQWPAMQASTSLMAPQEQLSRIAGLNQTMMGSMNIVAPPLGALLLGVLPLQAIMGIDVVTAALAIVSLLLVHIPRPESTTTPTANGSKPSLLADVGVGLRYVGRWPGLMAIMGMATIINFLLNPAFSLMPLLVTKHFGGDALQLAWINSASGFGIVLGGITLGVWGGFKRRIVTSLVGLIGMGLGILLIGLAPTSAFWLALVGMAWMGLMMPLANGPIFAMMQSIIAPDMQGRIFTLLGSLAGAMSPLGLLVAGPVADTFGVRAWYLVGAIACLVMGVLAFLTPAVIRLEDRNGNTPQTPTHPMTASPAGAVE